MSDAVSTLLSPPPSPQQHPPTLLSRRRLSEQINGAWERLRPPGLSDMISICQRPRSVGHADAQAAATSVPPPQRLPVDVEAPISSWVERGSSFPGGRRCVFVYVNLNIFKWRLGVRWGSVWELTASPWSWDGECRPLHDDDDVSDPPGTSRVTGLTSSGPSCNSA